MKQILDPALLFDMPLAAGTEADQQVTTRVEAAFSSVDHSVVPLRGIPDELSFVSKSFENSDFLRHS